MEKEDVKKEYMNLKEKYGLPDFENADSELEISCIESSIFLLRKIRQKVSEKADEISAPISSILQPNPDSFSEMHECRFFEDDEKSVLVEAYKKLMKIKRAVTEAEVMNRDEMDADVVNAFFSEIEEIRKAIAPSIKKLKLCWEEEAELEEKMEYFV